MKRNLFFLLGIVLIAFVLRFYQLGSIAPSLTWDEVAWGYNAYSLGIDGKDEFGRFLPYDYLESFGDFKPPVYAYLDVIPVKLLGLTEFAVRLPSALFGVLTVLVSFFLVKQIFWKSKNAENYALMTSLILAVSPWHIMLSRGAFEANVATFFLVSGIWLFLLAIHEKKWAIVLSAVFFALSIFTFNTSRVFAPLIVLVLGIAFRKELFLMKKETIVAIIAGLLIVLPVAGFLLSPQAQLRFKEVNIFSDPEVVISANQMIENDGNSIVSKVFHNRRVLYAISYAQHYFDHFNPSYLFIKGDGNPKFSIQSVGQMYLWDIIFFVAGIFLLFRKREGHWWLIFVWLLLAIVPAATARETPHALRTETALPMYQIIVAYGFVTLVSNLKKYKKAILTVLFLGLFANVLYFSYDYFVHYPRTYSGEWQYGYEESIAYVKSVEDDYDAIYITQELGRPYIYYLFYTKKDPREFRKEARVKRDAFGFVNVEEYGKYKFSSNAARDKEENPRVLYIQNKYDTPGNARVLKEFKLLNGDLILSAYTL